MVCSAVRPLASTSVTSARALKMLSKIKLRPLKSSHSLAQRVRSAMKCRGAFRPNCFLGQVLLVDIFINMNRFICNSYSTNILV